MKKHIKNSLLLLLVGASSLSIAAPRDHDYHWVVETGPENQTVFRIYEQGTHLVYEEKIIGRKLDIRKKNVRRQLDKGLKLYVESMEQLARLNRQSLLKSFAFR